MVLVIKLTQLWPIYGPPPVYKSDLEEKPIYIRPEHIIVVQPNRNGTGSQVWLSSGAYFEVKEDAEYILNDIKPINDLTKYYK